LPAGWHRESRQETVKGRARYCANGIVGLTEERQRILHLPKGLGSLHDVAQLDRPAEEARRLKNERKHNG
jgi:hypothetical protein